MNYKDNYTPGEQEKNSIVPLILYVPATKSSGYSPYTIANSFIENADNSQSKTDIEDFFEQKVELSKDRINLILTEINTRDTLKYDNLKRLYDDLFKIDRWRIERPFPENYCKDGIWNDLNRMELQIRDQIRRELKDSTRDTAFPQKDLRESLLEFKLKKQKADMIDSTLETELDSFSEGETGDTDANQKTMQTYYKRTYR